MEYSASTLWKKVHLQTYPNWLSIHTRYIIIHVYPLVMAQRSADAVWKRRLTRVFLLRTSAEVNRAYLCTRFGVGCDNWSFSFTKECQVYLYYAEHLPIPLMKLLKHLWFSTCGKSTFWLQIETFLTASRSISPCRHRADASEIS